MVWEGIQAQNMRPNRLDIVSSMNTVLFVNTTIGFSENPFLVYNLYFIGRKYVCILLHDQSRDIYIRSNFH